MNRIGSLAILCCGVLGAGCAAEEQAGATDELEQRIAELATPLVDPSGAPGKAVGLLVAVATPTVRASMGFGATVIGGSTHPAGDTIFEIGSVTKVFTGYLFARALGRGEVALDDPIDPFFPLGAPHYGARSITLLDLATHTSRLPSFPTNLHAPPPNPAAGYTVADLESFMATYPLEGEPGTTYLYSNLGAGVLGHGVRLTAGAPSFEALVTQEIAQPIGLIDTAVILSPAQQSRLAMGYDRDEAPPNDIGPGLDAGGALRSTGDDLVRFVAAASGEGPTDAASTWATVLEPRRPSPFGENGHTGLLVNVEDRGGRRIYSKGGGTAGFTSQIVFTTSPPIAVVLLANSKDVAGLRDLGLAIFDEL